MALHTSYEEQDYRGARIELTLEREYDDELLDCFFPTMRDMGHSRFPWIDAEAKVVSFAISLSGVPLAEDFPLVEDQPAHGRAAAESVSRQMVDFWLDRRPGGARECLIEGYSLHSSDFDGYSTRWMANGDIPAAYRSRIARLERMLRASEERGDETFAAGYRETLRRVRADEARDLARLAAGSRLAA